VQKLIPFLYGLFLSEKNYLKILDKSLSYLLLLRKKIPSARQEISCLIDKYNNFPRMIHKKISFKMARRKYEKEN